MKCQKLIKDKEGGGPIPPRYQPFLEGSSLAHSAQRYKDIQLDGRTYFVRYENYDVLVDRCDERLLKGAQEYVLYRAGELAKSNGAKYFVVLHKDDWNQGFEIFRLEDWRVEEHLSREIKTWGACFVMNATVVPQHKLDLVSPEPAFHADAIRSQVFP